MHDIFENEMCGLSTYLNRNVLEIFEVKYFACSFWLRPGTSIILKIMIRLNIYRTFVKINLFEIKINFEFINIFDEYIG